MDNNIHKSYKLPATMKKRAEFLALKAGRRAKSPFFLIQSAPQQASKTGQNAEVRLGFTISKKTGKAVERNRIKRRLREAARRIDWSKEEKQDYNIIAYRASLHSDFQSLQLALRKALAYLKKNIKPKAP